MLKRNNSRKIFCSRKICAIFCLCTAANNELEEKARDVRFCGIPHCGIVEGGIDPRFYIPSGAKDPTMGESIILANRYNSERSHKRQLNTLKGENSIGTRQ